MSDSAEQKSGGGSGSQTPPRGSSGKALISKSPTLPFMGLRKSDFAIFEYVTLDLKFPTLKIALPPWMVQREQLRAGEELELNTMLQVDGSKFCRATVIGVQHNERLGSEVAEVSLLETPHEACLVSMTAPQLDVKVEIPPGITSPEFFRKVLNDSALLKKGISVYLSHLVPFFSRVAALSDTEYHDLRSVFISDLVGYLGASIKKLETYVAELPPTNDAKTFGKWVAQSNWPGILMELQAALPYDIFETALQNKLATNYLISIKTSERRLFLNYNALVALFVQYL